VTGKIREHLATTSDEIAPVRRELGNKVSAAEAATQKAPEDPVAIRDEFQAKVEAAEAETAQVRAEIEGEAQEARAETTRVRKELEEARKELELIQQVVLIEREGLQQAAQTALDEQAAEYAREHEMLVRTHEAALEDQAVDHASELEQLERTHEAALEDLAADHTMDLERIERTTLAEREQLEKTHESVLDAQKVEHTLALERQCKKVKKLHDQRLRELRSQSRYNGRLLGIIRAKDAELEEMRKSIVWQRAEVNARSKELLGQIESLRAANLARELQADVQLDADREFERRMNETISGVAEAVREGAQLLGIPIAEVEGPLEEDTPLPTCVQRLARQASLRLKDNWERPIKEIFQRFGLQGANLVQEDQPLLAQLGQLFEKLKEVVQEEHDEVVSTHAHIITIIVVLVTIYKDSKLANREQIAAKDTLIKQLLERREFLRAELKKRNAIIQELSEALGLQDASPEI
jgi:hypothetical protein